MVGHFLMDADWQVLRTGGQVNNLPRLVIVLPAFTDGILGFISDNWWYTNDISWFVGDIFQFTDDI